MSNTVSTVSIAIPAYNESAKIEQVVRGFLGSNYPYIIEIFVADGGSTDGTQKIVEKLSTEDVRIKLLHNSQKTRPAGLNLILSECTGDIFLTADGHSDYASDYIERCVEGLQNSNACNVGGAQRFVAENSFQAGVALASLSLLGNGGAKYRNPNYSGYADTVYLGCFWKKSLLELHDLCVKDNPNKAISLNFDKTIFDPTQITNADSELNQKLIAKNEQAIYIDSKIRVWYYPRKSYKSLILQYFRYGRGRYLTSTKHPKILQLRGILPFVVISTALLLLIVDFLFTKLDLPMELVILGGLLLPFLESLRVTLKHWKSFNSEIWRGSEHEVPSFISRFFFCGIALLSMPISHFAGYGYQLFRNQVLQVSNW